MQPCFKLTAVQREDSAVCKARGALSVPSCHRGEAFHSGRCGGAPSAAGRRVVQVMDSVQTLDGGRRSTHDPDEIEEEQKERDIRNKVRPAACSFRPPALSGPRVAGDLRHSWL